MVQAPASISAIQRKTALHEKELFVSFRPVAEQSAKEKPRSRAGQCIESNFLGSAKAQAHHTILNQFHPRETPLNQSM
jgi:hypothetical protein